MSRTRIEWTDETWPVVTGCTPVSEGCRNCFAARMAATRLKHHPRYEGLATIENGKARWTGEVRLNHDVLEQPLHWKRPRRIFVASMGDLFHGNVPYEFIERVYDVMRQAKQHAFQVLTKRPVIAADFLLNCILPSPCYLNKADIPLIWPNVWLGTSIENQAAADERIPLLLRTPGAVHYVSVEPMLDTVDLTNVRVSSMEVLNALTGVSSTPHSEPPRYDPLDWVICGGESGPGARPMPPQWARDIRDQCQAASIPYFHKQNGEYIPADGYNQWGTSLDGKLVDPAKVRAVQVIPGDIYSTIHMVRVGKKRAGHLLDGRTWQEFPGRK